MAQHYATSMGNLAAEEFIIKAVTKAHGNLGKIKDFNHLCAFVATTTKNAIRDELKRRAAVKHGSGKVQHLYDSEIGITEEYKPPDPIKIESLIERVAERRKGKVAEEKKIIPDEATHRLLLAEWFRSIFLRIDKRYSEVVWDCFIEELTHKEIARKRCLSIGSIGVYLKRGLNAMLEFMPERHKLQLWDETETPKEP